jgi:phosphoglycolate phosphatase
LLAALSIADRFRFVFAPAMSALDEPKTVTVAKALDALGAAGAAVIGDRSFDVEAAHANGARAIGVTWGIGDRRELHTAGADVIVERPAELLELLQPG